uniref:Glutamate decarboxylase n=1 Tax=Brassica campestris TaxID=3711 RepID=A0A3P6A1V7_BRACM|nr:unnamed protein product [Brassica rapa]
MVLSHAASDSDVSVHSTFASRYVRTSLPRFRMPENSIPKEAAYQIINDELMLDGNPRLNLASFVTTWMEPECDKLIMASINKNYVDMDEYPVTTELQNRCVNMIAHLFNAPLGETETAVGVGTVGSSEAIMLAGLAFKRKWQNKRKAEGKPFDKPNIVTGANVQVCWEKFARYFEVELKEVKLREGYYVMDPEQAVEMVDENTICVAAILGSTLNGEFEDVKLLNDLLVLKNKETGLDIPIHVDAASGGFIAPFLYPELEWDFRLPQVKSINVSGHKYGLVYAGIGWVVWRNKEDLPDELIFHINYLGADQPTFTLNFSKGSSQVIAQYYQLIRLGHEGYRNVMENCRENMIVLREGLEKTGRFSIVSKDEGIPLVAFSLKDNSSHTEFEISEMLRRYGWIVPAYTMPANAEHITVLRVVIREDFSRTLAERLVMDIEKVMHELDELPSRVINKISLGEVGHEHQSDTGSSQVIAQYYQLIRLGHEGYRNVMENCRENMIVLREGLEKTGRFNIVSKDEGVPLVAFSLKDSSSHTEFEISDMLRRYGWIVPAYTMPPNAQHITVLRVVIREDFSRTLAERLVIDIEKVIRELDELPSRVIHKISLGEEKSEANGDNLMVTVKKTEMEKQREIINGWKKFVSDRKKTNGIC